MVQAKQFLMALPDSYGYSDSYNSCNDSSVDVLHELSVARVQVSVKLQTYNYYSRLHICDSELWS